MRGKALVVEWMFRLWLNLRWHAKRPVAAVSVASGISRALENFQKSLRIRHATLSPSAQN
jgi:hypothetical protein